MARARLSQKKNARKLKHYDIFRFSYIAYIIGRGSEYEVLDIKKAVSEMVGWCEKAPQNGIRILKDERILRTDDCIRDECKAGKAKIVIYVPKVVATLGYIALYQLFGENEKIYLFNKAIYPLRSERCDMEVIIH